MPRRWPKPTGGMKSGSAPIPPSLPMPYTYTNRAGQQAKSERNLNWRRGVSVMTQSFVSRTFQLADIISGFTWKFVSLHHCLLRPYSLRNAMSDSASPRPTPRDK